MQRWAPSTTDSKRGEHAVATVSVSKPGNRLIYINGDYSEAAGNSNAGFTVPSGGQCFETLTQSRRVDYRKSFRVSPQQSSVTIELDRVDPPEPI